MKFKRIAIDTSKHVFTLHGVDEQDRPVLRRELKRGQVEAFFAKQEATEVVLEACGGSHHWGRLLNKLGHRVRLIPPQYVKPFVKRTKNDRNDAEAISEAASRPTMRSVVVKTVDQQADGIILKHREMLVGQRTQAINALRGHAAEFGVVAAKGTVKVAALLTELAADSAIPASARAMFARMGAAYRGIGSGIGGCGRRTDGLAQGQPGQPAAGHDPRRWAARRDHHRPDDRARKFRVRTPLRRLAWLDTEGTFHRR